MSGFERAEWSAAWPDAEELSFPDDFTADEAEFAHDLRGFYAVERDEPPPLYAQTLLGCERPSAAEPGFEERVFYTVFRQLALPRPAPFTAEPALAWLRGVLRSMSDSLMAIPRAIATASMALMAFMAVSVVIASPSFAAGMNILLGHTGVEQVSSYPANVQTHHEPPVRVSAAPKATPDPTTPVYWLGASYGGFSYAGIRELHQPFWAQGPMLDLTYISHTPGRVTTDTPAVVNIREFQIAGDWSAVLQMVQAGYATEVTIGDEQAVYVNGSWTLAPNGAHPGDSRVWTPGQKSELILEYAGEIFWISGDQRYGVDQATLVSIAQHLLVAQISQLSPHVQMSRLAGQELQAMQADPGEGEVVKLVAAGKSPSSGAASFVAIAGDPSEK